MPTTNAPFDGDGNMISYPRASYTYAIGEDGKKQFKRVDPELVEVPPFEADMRVIGMETGRSAKRLVLQDQATGKTYPLFVADIVKILQDVPIVGTWGPSKRGQNYGIKRLS